MTIEISTGVVSFRPQTAEQDGRSDGEDGVKFGVRPGERDISLVRMLQGPRRFPPSPLELILRVTLGPEYNQEKEKKKGKRVQLQKADTV